MESLFGRRAGVITRSAWEFMQIVRVTVLLGFLPILLYRVWRIWRYPTSPPAVAATGFGLLVWIWMLAFTDRVWATMPPGMHAVSMGGWAIVTMAGCLRIFAIGINGEASPAQIRRGARISLVVTAGVLVAVALTACRSSVLVNADDLYTVTNALVGGGDSWAILAAVLSNAFAAVVLVQLAWVGWRHADRTPVGAGLGLLAAASAFEFVAIVSGGIWRPLSRGEGLMARPAGLWLQTFTGSVGAMLLIGGFLWPPVMLRIEAHRDLRRLAPIHDRLTGMFPRLRPSMKSQIMLSELVYEWATDVQDGLTLLAQRRHVPFETSVRAPIHMPDRIAAINDWLSGDSVPGFNTGWLQAPPGVSDNVWVFAIADAYRRGGRSRVSEGSAA